MTNTSPVYKVGFINMKDQQVYVVAMTTLHLVKLASSCNTAYAI